jgi:hypothetical protein
MKQLSLIAVAITLLLSSCSKSYDALPSNSKYLTGNGGTQYLPLTVGNTWSYRANWNTVITTHSITSYTINETGSYPNSTSCNVWIDTATGNYMMQYLNSPLTNVGITGYFNLPKAFVYIPGSTNVAQTWTDTICTGVILTTRVVNPSASVGTELCAYSDCLEMSYTYAYNYGGTNAGSVTWTKYFKKGVGVAYATCNVNEIPTYTYGLKDFTVN